MMLRRVLFLTAMGLTWAGASPVQADCFEYKPDSFAPSQIVRQVREGATKEIKTTLQGRVQRHSVWIGATNYIAVQVGSKFFQPKIEVAHQGSARVFAQSWSLQPAGENKFAEVHYSGRQAHAKGGNGWTDLIVSAENGTDTGPYIVWIFPIEKLTSVPADHCDKVFIRYQNGYRCDTCNATVNPCPPGKTDYGMFGATDCR